MTNWAVILLLLNCNQQLKFKCFSLLQMKKQEVNNLEDEFTNLFNNVPQQQLKQKEAITGSINVQQKPQQLNSQTFKEIALSESEDQQDFSDQMHRTQQNDGGIQVQRITQQRLQKLNSKQLQMLCQNLQNTNFKLTQRINELQQPKSQIISESSLEGSKSDLTIMQQDFVQLQQELSSYKSQLSQYQQHMSQKLGEKDQEIEYLRNQLNNFKSLRSHTQMLELQLSDRDRIISLLQRKNQQLLLQIEEERQNWSTRDTGRSQHYFNDKISNQMESLIDKLVKQLKFQKKNASKHLAEIKRLSSELLQIEGILKQKNKKIYQLQLLLLKINKNQHKQKLHNFREKERFATKPDFSQSQSGYQIQDMTPYSPTRSQRGQYIISPKKSQQEASQNRNRSMQRDRSYQKNQISAQRQGAIRGTAGGVLLKSLSFTLMDLLNHEFKIRQAQKEIVASRIIDLYSKKIMQQHYQNLIPEQIEIYSFSSQNPTQIKVRASPMTSRGEREQVSQRQLLYNMSFILDTLLNQVEVVDAFVENSLNLNVSQYVSQLQLKNSKEEKFVSLQELAKSIESYYMPS